MTLKFIQGSLAVFEKKSNICGSQKKPIDIIMGRSLAGMPKSCPVPNAKVHCFSEEKILVLNDSLKRILDLYGKFKHLGVRVEVVHDIGKSCIDADFMFSKD
jgi:hypothetical protein